MTAHTTTQSDQTADFQADVKQTIFCGDFGLFLSALSVSGGRCGLSAGFWRSVSACKNSVPGSGIAAGQCRGRPGIMVVLRIQKRRSRPTRTIADSTRGPRTAAPFGRRIAQPFDANAASQPAFDRCSNEVRREESQRDSHLDLTHAAFLPCGNLLDIGDRARHVKPATTSGDCTDQPAIRFWSNLRDPLMSPCCCSSRLSDPEPAWSRGIDR